MLRSVRQIRLTPVIETFGLIEQPHGEDIRIFLMPLKSGFGSPDAKAEIIALANANLRCDEDPSRAIRETKQNVRVVIELTSTDERRQIGA